MKQINKEKNGSLLINFKQKFSTKIHSPLNTKREESIEREKEVDVITLPKNKQLYILLNYR
jgi:hypothetical protein